jgi:hypothetical protein
MPMDSLVPWNQVPCLSLFLSPCLSIGCRCSECALHASSGGARESPEETLVNTGGASLLLGALKTVSFVAWLGPRTEEPPAPSPERPDKRSLLRFRDHGHLKARRIHDTDASLSCPMFVWLLAKAGRPRLGVDGLPAVRAADDGRYA